MKTGNRILVFFLINVNIIFCPVTLPAQEQQQVRVFLDCDGCPGDFIRQQISLVSFVRDRKVADVHLFIARIASAGGGQIYEFQFLGLSPEARNEVHMKTEISANHTEIERNTQILETIRAGLLPFVYRYGQYKLSIDHAEHKEKSAAQKTDGWDYWVFDVGGSFFWSKESNQSEYDIDGAVEIERTTEAWRVRSEVYFDYEVKKVKRQDQLMVSDLRRTGASASVVKSLGEQWSAGISGSATSTTFNNLAFGSSLQAALEYNFFPYRMSTTKEFTIAYAIGPQHSTYLEETIYNQTSETRMRHNITVSYDVRQPWGRIEADLIGSQYFFDMQKKRLEFEGELALRLFKGFFVTCSLDAALVQDQLFLPKGDASLEEILLERRAISTDYELGFRVGLAYTFGSIYNSVVNTRL